MSSRLHTVWDRLASRVAVLNTAMGVMTLGPEVVWEGMEGRRRFIPSDFSVPMMSHVSLRGRAIKRERGREGERGRSKKVREERE